MLTRTPLIAANWKMNPPPLGFDGTISAYREVSGVDVVVLPTFLDLARCLKAKLVTGAQYGHDEKSGAHSGDVSLSMIKDLGCTWVMCGHSERRRDHGETDELVAKQAVAAVGLGLNTIVCIGETQAERDGGKTKEVVERQLLALLDHPEMKKGHALESVTIAYEPVWAIGTGKTATPEDAQEIHAFIRSLLPETVKEKMRILYGGSMNAKNAEALLKQTDIDGGLIGGASLKPDDFGEIVKIAQKLTQ